MDKALIRIEFEDLISKFNNDIERLKRKHGIDGVVLSHKEEYGQNATLIYHSKFSLHNLTIEIKPEVPF
jgi:hypothetical protein